MAAENIAHAVYIEDPADFAGHPLHCRPRPVVRVEPTRTGRIAKYTRDRAKDTARQWGAAYIVEQTTVGGRIVEKVIAVFGA
jgi:hypothetical protein